MRFVTELLRLKLSSLLGNLSGYLDLSKRFGAVQKMHNGKWYANFHSERPKRENGTTLSLLPIVFQWNELKSDVSFTDILFKWKTTTVTVTRGTGSFLSKLAGLLSE